MSLTAEDRLEIHEVLALHGHLCDAGDYDRFDLVFTADLQVDVSALGYEPVRTGPASRPSLATYIEVARRRGPGSTLAMHVTNIIVRADGDGARAWSKGMTVGEDGRVASFTYADHLVRTGHGWRIRHRTVSPHREPGRGVPVR
ncbi:hypothetical protein ACWT_5379 [Actinoplanes sp. SE50]|uniref:nuclear transport factor 2 family protein n=1 Tax=unclassified Actinoplanes TaxID=2626549 RepID=UPI00023EC4D3|nr:MULTISPECIES: nuclear transport factor 2 family protein [unclassified Actinoplanes]AEV86397.1 uncharacterized protein ACPL_5510 [Actinoplanes sp. SE50/110]ATO84794.1 hypothetical protein ACWT_5379 [Actinoplanes sp. SE50]SLM02204.1 hypothetical protein ACSP50_5442 [Actinoplanes sp. SE50/110]